MACADGHLVLNRQPVGGLIGDGISSPIADSDASTVEAGSGADANKTRVYGCAGKE